MQDNELIKKLTVDLKRHEKNNVLVKKRGVLGKNIATERFTKVGRRFTAQQTYSLETELNKYRRPQVLFINELDYVALDTQASNLFFQVISSRHDAELGMIATTNMPFGEFNQIFANDAIAHAIVDRLVNEAEVFYMDWDSFRPREREQKLKRKKTKRLNCAPDKNRET